MALGQHSLPEIRSVELGSNNNNDGQDCGQTDDKSTKAAILANSKRANLANGDEILLEFCGRLLCGDYVGFYPTGLTPTIALVNDLNQIGLQQEMANRVVINIIQQNKHSGESLISTSGNRANQPLVMQLKDDDVGRMQTMELNSPLEIAAAKQQERGRDCDGLEVGGGGGAHSERCTRCARCAWRGTRSAGKYVRAKLLGALLILVMLLD